MSTATVPQSDVVHIGRCAIHGLHGQCTECHVCGGPVEQVAMVPFTEADERPQLVAVVPVERYCQRKGCTRSLRGMRDDAVWCTDACRVAAYRKRKAVRSRNRAHVRPGGRQLAFGVAVRVLARYLVEARVVTDADRARSVAEKVLERALPATRRPSPRPQAKVSFPLAKGEIDSRGK